MPNLPLRRRLLDELDDIDCSFKRARLLNYIRDMSSDPAHDGSDANIDSSQASISSISSISSASSIDSDDEDTASSLSLSFSDIQDLYFLATRREIDRLREELLNSRVLRKNPPIVKSTQLPLLKHWRNSNVDQFRRNVRVDPEVFDG